MNKPVVLVCLHLNDGVLTDTDLPDAVVLHVTRDDWLARSSVKYMHRFGGGAGVQLKYISECRCLARNVRVLHAVKAVQKEPRRLWRKNLASTVVLCLHRKLDSMRSAATCD